MEKNNYSRFSSIFFFDIISVAGLIQIGENKIYLSHIFIVSVDSTRYLDADVCVCVCGVWVFKIDRMRIERSFTGATRPLERT